VVVGILKLTLLLAENHSLKGKRSVLGQIKGRVLQKFNVSVAECDAQGLWQKAVLGFSIAGSDRRVVDSSLRHLIRFVEGMNLAEVLAEEIEILNC
jgi:uncharacterized protein YlxP (DUF503 family)